MISAKKQKQGNLRTHELNRLRDSTFQLLSELRATALGLVEETDKLLGELRKFSEPVAIP